jgi:rod shape-determining protein MreD
VTARVRGEIMADVKNHSPYDTGKGQIGIGKTVIYSACIFILLVLGAFLQIGGIELFGAAPAITLALVCAVGFIFGDKYGAIFAIFAGALIDILSSAGFSLIPVMYFICGYLCGKLRGVILRVNFPSFLVFATLAGVIREIFTLIYFALHSKSFELSKLIIELLIPEYFAYIVCVIPAYFAVLAIYLLFKGKENKSKRVL